MPEPAKHDRGDISVSPPKPIAVIPIVGVTPLGAYEKLAAELEFFPAQLLEEQLLRFLVENSIPTYNYEEVSNYLSHKASQQKETSWIWRPLRERDKPEEEWFHNDGQKYNEGKYFRPYGTFTSPWYDRPYFRAVPSHILRRVQKIQTQFPTVLFFVSDYVAENPDPFIMVTAPDVKRIVFGVWDEPAFEERET